MILRNNFIEFKHESCPVCGHRGRCKNSAEHPGDLILCFRINDELIDGFRRVKSTSECTTYVRIGSSADRNGKPGGFSMERASPNLNEKAKQYAAALADEQVQHLANDLGVSAQSLRAINIGIVQGNPCFPERDASGNVVGTNVRHPDGSKRVGKGHRRGLIIPNELDSLPDPVLIVEGPSDVAACLTMGLTAVGRPNNTGGGKELAELLSEREVIVVGENDQKPDESWPGREGATKIAAELSNAWDKPVSWALPPANVKDVRDYLLANHVCDPLEMGRNLLVHLRANAIAVEPFVGNVGSVPRELPKSWPDPQPLPDELPPVALFEFELLPDSFREWIKDITDRSQCPPDFPAVGAMVSLAAVVGRKVGIRPKCRDDWTAVPNLWGAIIGRSGLLKTPMLEETTRPLKRIEIDAKKRYEAEVRQHAARLMVADARRKQGEKQVLKALNEGKDAEAVAEAVLSAEGDNAAPVRRRILINDCTVEKLGEILNHNPNGVLQFRDELVGFLRSLEKEGYESARAFYLEAWNGAGRFTYDRIVRGTIDIESTTVSILGGIQPSVLQQYLRSSLRDVGDDGLIQRFQLVVWPDVSREWRNIDQWPDTTAKNRAYAVFQRMDALDTATIGAQSDGNADGIPFLRFDNAAQEMFDQWREKLEHRLRSDEFHPILESHLAKYRSLIPSLALLIHLADGGTGPIGITSLRKAIAWGEYLETHARRLYFVAVNPDIAAAKALSEKIVNGSLSDGFALRDVYRQGWAGLTDREVLKRATEVLVDLDWIACTREETLGAPRTRFWVNPKIQDHSTNPTDKTDKSPASALLSVLSVPSGGVSRKSGPMQAAKLNGGQEAIEDDSDSRERKAIMEIEVEAAARHGQSSGTKEKDCSS
ncbi:MAG: DUF3987 domain-containing protein [Planctomycetota bacterium]